MRELALKKEVWALDRGVLSRVNGMPGNCGRSGCHDTMEASAEDNPTRQRWSVSVHELGRQLGVWLKNQTRCTSRAQHRLANGVALCRGALAPSRGRRKQGSAHCPQESAHGCCHDPGPPRLILASETRDQAVSAGPGSADVLGPCLFPHIKHSRPHRLPFARVPPPS